MTIPRQVAALFVEDGGCYSGLPGVDPWPESRDARTYGGPNPVVAHPPCQRWGNFWHGTPARPHQYRLGDDGGCFAAALAAARTWGGVIEHPAGSRAWAWFGIAKPRAGAGWVPAGNGGWTCSVDQGHYGHFARKSTWLLAYGMPRDALPELEWSRADQPIPAWMIERYGERKARKIGLVAMVGGKDKTRIRNATPPAFRDVLLTIARTAAPSTT